MTRGTGVYLWEVKTLEDEAADEVSSEVIAQAESIMQDEDYEVIGKYGSVELRCFYLVPNIEGRKENLVVGVIEDELVFVSFYRTVQYADLDGNKRSAAVNSFIQNTKRIKGLPEYFMLEIQLDRYDAILTDNSQTYKGQAFWKKLYTEAQRRNYNIYGVIQDGNKYKVKNDASSVPYDEFYSFIYEPLVVSPGELDTILFAISKE